ncbi:MAG TPA: sodium-translocating pyrophosphatase [Anaerolineaceae bacterium]|nr:sodium-translocating pyrophosphatase [Anaerolineaceae bacterium]HPN50848.1 sodium-translocating pyrophosphatase [Anaerolineaceae bacterium]
MYPHGLNGFEFAAIIGVLVVAFLSLAYAWWLRGVVLKNDKGTSKMQEVWSAISEGADSYLNRQLKTILPAIVILAVALFLSVYVAKPSAEATHEFGDNALIVVAIGRTIAFIMGASFSLMVGQLGMRMAIQANVRAAEAARHGFNQALSIAYYAGTITGMLTDGLGLLGGTIIFLIFGTAAPDALLGFGFGGTLLALFMRVGGGIYTKAADVGADLVGKVEKDIPEDDPRNAAVVADLVGDNVGDCAGMAADIFESYEVTIVSALILGLALAAIEPDPTMKMRWIVYPLIIRGIGVLSSILGTFTVPIWEKFPIKFLRAHDAEESMFRSYEVSSVNTVVWAFVVAMLYANDWRLGLLTAIGVGLAVAFNPLTSYFTSTKRAPVQEIVEATKTGPATTILSGLSVGMESSVWALFVIVISFIFALMLYSGEGDATYVLYAVAMIGIGMLSHTGNNVAMDSYGPISDNANGIGEMAWHGMDDENTRKARQIMADLDAVGNTTKAITKGVAIASAVIAAVSLFASFITDIVRVEEQLLFSKDFILNSIRVSDTKVFIGMLLGGALPWLFSSLSIRAVSRAASEIVEEVRAQFRIPGLMEGKVKPDYAKVVGISTRSAQKELIPLAVISIVLPLIVGLVLQVEALGGFLAGVILSGQLLAVFMSNAGGAWDNAKKAIEDEPRSLEKNTGKGSERHKAGVVGDTVGDPLKDTAGPALNPMIKVVNIVSLLVAPIIVQFENPAGVSTEMQIAKWVVIVLLAAGMVWGIMQSKKPAAKL